MEIVVVLYIKEHERRKSSFLYTALEKSKSVTNIQNFFSFPAPYRERKLRIVKLKMKIFSSFHTNTQLLMPV